VIFIISGPSGVGKTSIDNALQVLRPSFHRPVSCTTRSRKRGEVNGKDYHFLSRDNFVQMIEKGLFAEYAEVYGNFYGTLGIDLMLRGCDAVIVLVIDVQGMRQVKAKHKNVVSIFILPPTFEALEARIRERSREETEEEIATWLETARQELSCASEYSHQIVNDDLMTTVRAILDVLDGKDSIAL